MTNKRRYFIITVSLTIGTILSALLLYSRMGTLKGTDYMTLVFNMIIAAAVIVALGVVFKTMDKKHNGEKDKKKEL